MAKTLFISPGPFKWASTRLRAAWITPHLEDSAWIPIDQVNLEIINQFDNLVWVKKIDEAMIDATPDKSHYWDLCDPVHWWYPDEARYMVGKAKALVASNQGLAEDLAQWCGQPVKCITDRLDVSHFDLMHSHDNNTPQRFIWFGASQNRIGLMSAWVLLERLACNGVQFELTIMDDQPGQAIGSQFFPVYHVNYNYGQEVRIIASHSLAILPPYPGRWGDVKSNNRALTAWACGAAVWDNPHDYDQLFELATRATLRETQAKAGRWKVTDLFNVERSAAEWRKVLE